MYRILNLKLLYIGPYVCLLLMLYIQAVLLVIIVTFCLLL